VSIREPSLQGCEDSTPISVTGKPLNRKAFAKNVWERAKQRAIAQKMGRPVQTPMRARQLARREWASSVAHHWSKPVNAWGKSSLRLLSLVKHDSSARLPDSSTAIPTILPSSWRSWRGAGALKPERPRKAAVNCWQDRASNTTCVVAEPKETITHSILAIAEEWKADLIVLGSHGRRGFDRLIMGSVSETVAAHAKCSVEVVRMHQRHRNTRVQRSGLCRHTHTLEKIRASRMPRSGEGKLKFKQRFAQGGWKRLRARTCNRQSGR
jgi:hypothetical protein